MSISQNIFCRVKLISQYSAVARRDPSLSDSLQITEPVTVLYYPPRRPVPSVYCTVQCVQCTVQPAGTGWSKYRMLTRVSQQGTLLLWSHGQTFVSLSYNTIPSVLNTFTIMIRCNDGVGRQVNPHIRPSFSYNLAKSQSNFWPTFLRSLAMVLGMRNNFHEG